MAIKTTKIDKAKVKYKLESKTSNSSKSSKEEE